LRTIQRRNKNGSVVRYLQLAHNEWDADAGHAKARVLYQFGREEQVDRDAIRRLIASLSRALGPQHAVGTEQAPELQFLSSRPMGGAWALDQLWRRLGVQRILQRLLQERRLDPRAERVLFAMVANRALRPLSKLACTSWVGEEVWIEGLEKVEDESCYRTMDWLLEIEPELAEQVYFAVADLLNLEVDLVFFDTSSTYFEMDEADPASSEGTVGFRTYGHSKDHRDDLPQVVIGMAVTREGIPIRVWSWPGNTSDQSVVEQVKEDLRGWKLGRVVWALDRGFNSARNRRLLQRAGGQYIIGEKLRGDQPEAKAALSRQGRYRQVAGNLEVKEVQVEHGSEENRFVICRNPEAVKRDAAVRERLLAQLEKEIKGSDGLSESKRRELAGAIATKPGLNRFLRLTPRGLLRIDRQAAEAEQALDGKYLLRTSDPSLSAEDVALGYKQLLEVERGWRDFKLHLDLRPVYHRKQERIQAHILLCWLALLLIRIAECRTSQTWNRLRQQLERLHLGSFRVADGICWKRTELSAAQRAILSALELPEPPLIVHLDAAPAEGERSAHSTAGSPEPGPPRRRRRRTGTQVAGEQGRLRLREADPPSDDDGGREADVQSGAAV
jgi:transposase